MTSRGENAVSALLSSLDSTHHLHTCPSILTVGVQVIQIPQVLGVDDGRPRGSLTGPADGLIRVARGASHIAGLPAHVPAVDGKEECSGRAPSNTTSLGWVEDNIWD